MNDRALALRRAFDLSFAAPLSPPSAPMEELLAIRVGGDPYAVRASSIARLVSAPRIVAVPSKRAAVLGVAAVRGALVSVYSLAVLLRGPSDTCRWMVLVEAGEMPKEVIGLAFEELDGFLRVPKDAPLVGSQGMTRTIIDVRSIVEGITSGNAGPTRRDA